MAELLARPSSSNRGPSTIGRKTDFARTLAKGVRVSVRDMTVHLAPVGRSWPDPAELRPEVALTGGPWLGMIISKKVGDAVTRHAVARRIRAGFRQHRGALAVPETFVVVRAHPSIAQRSGADVADALHEAFTHRKVVVAGDLIVGEPARVDV